MCMNEQSSKCYRCSVGFSDTDAIIYYVNTNGIDDAWVEHLCVKCYNRTNEVM